MSVQRSKHHTDFSEKPKDEKKDTFAEKMATQVIKNLQVKITSIHIRYEDDVSQRLHFPLSCAGGGWGYCFPSSAVPVFHPLFFAPPQVSDPQRPLSMGVTLGELSLQVSYSALHFSFML